MKKTTITNRMKMDELITKCNKEWETGYSKKDYEGWAKGWLDADIDDPCFDEARHLTNPYSGRGYEVSAFVGCLVQMAYACCVRYEKAMNEFFRTGKKDKWAEKYVRTLDFVKNIVRMEDMDAYYGLLD